MVNIEGTRWKRMQTVILDVYVACKSSLVAKFIIFVRCVVLAAPLILPLSAQITDYVEAVDSKNSSDELAVLAISVTSNKLWLWQKRLSLQDWDMSIVLAHAYELRPNTLGNIHWDVEQKQAVITVLHPADYRLTQNEMLEDMEFTIVHELVHLNLARACKFQIRDADRRKEEQAVNRIVADLLKLNHAQLTRRLTWHRQKN